MDSLNALLGEEEALTYSRLLHRVYPMPKDTRSIDDFQRRRHRDIPLMAEEDLEAEVVRTQLRIWMEDDVDNRIWLKERKVEAQAELHQRARARAQENHRLHPVQIFGPPQENQTVEPGEPPAIPGDPHQFKFARKERAS
jgi:hypothetical protein